MSDPVPNAEEVKKQLQRMLESNAFKRAPNRDMLLKFVVEETLQGKKLSERIIGEELFPNWTPDDDDVRVTARNLRQTIQAYENAEGEHDLVRISLPPGPDYRPIFSYNTRHEAIASHRRGRFLLRSFSPTNLRTAKRYFEEIIKRYPDFAPPYSAWAEAILRIEALEYLMQYTGEHVRTGRGPTSQEFSQAKQNCFLAIKHDPTYWHGYYALAAIQAYEGQWNTARTNFEKAASLNYNEATSHIWYPAFLLAMGESETAVHMVRAAATEAPDDFLTQMTLTLFLHVTGQYKEANATCLTIALMVPAYSPESNVFKILSAHNRLALLHLIPPSPTDPSEDPLSWLIFISESSESILGLVALILRAYQRIHQSRVIHAGLFDAPDYKAHELVMAAIGADDYQAAIHHLRRSLDRPRFVLFSWLHIWPVFKPLHHVPGFDELLRKLNLPQHIIQSITKKPSSL